MENHFNMLRQGITNEAYHADLALNRSRADDLLTTCPLKVKYAMEQPSTSSPALLNGGHIHSGVLEPHLTDSEYGCKPAEIDGNSSRTKAYKEAFAEMEEANPSKRWIVESDYYNNQEVIASVLQHPMANNLLYDASSLIEHTGFYEIEGTPCKVRPDLYNKDSGIVLDLKTTIDASQKGFAKSVRQYGYLFQAAWYMTALRAMGERPKQFVFLVVEKSAPYATACYTLDNADIEREKPRVLEACKIYGECLRTDVWPGYSDDIKTLDLGTYYAKNRLSISQLAEKFGVSRSYAHRIIKKHNVVGQKLGKKRLIDMVEFSTALRWENTKKEVA
jgi:hypothetical protein